MQLKNSSHPIVICTCTIHSIICMYMNPYALPVNRDNVRKALISLSTVHSVHSVSTQYKWAASDTCTYNIMMYAHTTVTVGYLFDDLSRYGCLTHNRFATPFNPVDSSRLLVCTIVSTQTDYLQLRELLFHE